MVRGFSTGSSQTTDLLLLKAFLCSSSHQVQILWFCGERQNRAILWFRVQLEDRVAHVQY